MCKDKDKLVLRLGDSVHVVCEYIYKHFFFFFFTSISNLVLSDNCHFVAERMHACMLSVYAYNVIQDFI